MAVNLDSREVKCWCQLSFVVNQASISIKCLEGTQHQHVYLS